MCWVNLKLDYRPNPELPIMTSLTKKIKYLQFCFPHCWSHLLTPADETNVRLCFAADARDYGCFIYFLKVFSFWQCLASLYTQRIWERHVLESIYWFVFCIVCDFLCGCVAFMKPHNSKSLCSLFSSEAANVWINSEKVSHTLTFPQLLFSIQRIAQY